MGSARPVLVAAAIAAIGCGTAGPAQVEIAAPGEAAPATPPQRTAARERATRAPLPAASAAPIEPDVPGASDARVLEIMRRAMDEDFLGTDFDRAARRLEEARRACGSVGCTGPVLGKLHIALGTVYGTWTGDTARAQEEFVAARRADAGAQLVYPHATQELRKAFDAARRITQTP